jgi:hypothetical protein
VPREKTRKEIQTEKKNEDVFSKKKENFWMFSFLKILEKKNEKT